MSDKYIKLEINLLPFLELNKIDINDYKNLSNYINNIAKRPSFS